MGNRLTVSDKKAFVTAVMQDVPKEDFSGQIRSLWKDDIHSQLPSEIRQLVNSPLEVYLNQETVYSTSPCYNSTRVFCAREQDPVPSPVCASKVDELKKKWKVQKDLHNELRAKLEALVASVTTRSALIKLLPEFEKYAPPERLKVSNLPAVTGVVAALAEAGFPKSK